jgi:hypothetical protein
MYQVYLRHSDGKTTQVGRSMASNPYAAEKSIADMLGFDRERLFAKIATRR